MAVAVPGELMGYWEAHKKYGRLPWSELFKPAIKLCETGSHINDYLAAYLIEKEPMIKNETSLAKILINPDTGKVWIVSRIYFFIITVFILCIYTLCMYTLYNCFLSYV